MIENPEAVGNPDEEPVLHVSEGLARTFERTRCGECGLVNWQHEDDCSVTLVRDWYDETVRQPLARDLDVFQKSEAAKRRGLNG